MFRTTKNIDNAFRQFRNFSLFLVSASILLCGFTVYKSFRMVLNLQQKVYILANGKAIEAFASDRKENIPVEARDHIKTFHQYFFTLDPDDKVIKSNISKALYLADGSAKRVYDNMQESGYYANIIAGNISQQITVDSIQVSLDSYPYSFRCYASQRLVRTTSIVTRSLVTQGLLRNVSRSDNNPHGFLIEAWQTVDNRDIKIENR